MENKKIEIDSYAGLCGFLLGGLSANVEFAEKCLKYPPDTLDRKFFEMVTESLRNIFDEAQEHRKKIIR